jgi:outer membrane protein OmpA-like peptidoglycan-associated protein
MKKIAFIYLMSLCLISVNIEAQIVKPKEVVKRKSTDRANNKIDQTIDKGLDKIEDGIGNIFKKKEKNAKEDQPDANPSKTSRDNPENEEGSNGAEKIGSTNKKATTGATSTDKVQFSPTSKFDFVPGEKVIGFEDFSETAVGDFPLGWNTNSSAEIIIFNDNPEKWLSMTQDGFFQPDFVKDMPDNFTLEYDIFTRYRSNNILSYGFLIYSSDNPRVDFSEKYVFGKGGFAFRWSGGTEAAMYEVYENDEVVNKNEKLTIKSLFTGQEGDEVSKVHFAIWRQKNRLRMYADEVKVLDIPQAFNPKLKYNAFKFASEYMNYSNGVENKDEYMVGNIRYAVGAPDTRSKLITEGRFSTTGILFDVNSDRIKPSSEGTLKEIAQVLKENPTVKIKIIGHTDADGADAANQTLSEKRAASVKNTLAADFSIAADRMTTEGKGESQPTDKNDTPQGKANNRRVEFVKL